MDQMTAKQKIVVEELKNRTINDLSPKLLQDESVFYRFSKAVDFNLEEAETILRNHISKRNELNLDSILTAYEPPEVLVKYVPTSFICFDKEGGVVRIIECGRADLNGLWNVATITELVKFSAQIIEKDIERVIKRGGNLGKPMYAAIVDFEKLTYANAISVKNIQNLLYLLKLFAEVYPEVLKCLTVINALSYFSWLYAAIKPIFPSAIIQKIRIFGRDGWKEVLSDEINTEDLPAYLGGKRTDPDGNPLCESFMTHCKPIPKRYYLQNRKKTLSLEDNVKKFTVMPFSKQEITFEVKEENSFLEWEFETKNGEIDFMLLFRRETIEGFETVELIPKQRIDASYEPQKGFYKCDKVGDYTVVFDNSNSWFRLKEVCYRAGITNAKNYDFNI